MANTYADEVSETENSGHQNGSKDQKDQCLGK